MPAHVHRLRLPILFAAALLLVAVFVPLPSAKADVTFVVDNVTDNGALSACTAAADDCSLRGAIAAANATAGTDRIEFLIPAAQCPGGICPITLTEGQLELTEAVTIDATTQPQNSGPSANVCATATEPSHMRVEVITAPTVGDGIGFYVNHAGASVIKGFALGTDHGGGFDGMVKIQQGSGHHIACNHFGFDAAGSSALGSALLGVHIDFAGVSSDIVIGTNGDGVDDIGERNVFGFGGYLVYINANNNNTVAGNYLGFTADGATQVGGGWLLIRQSSSGNVIGTNGDGVSDELERNYFGNSSAINYQGFSFGGTNNKIAGNTFGLAPDGSSAPIANEGIRMTGLLAGNTGVEVIDNTIVTSSTGIGLSIAGDASGATVLVDGNSFGLLGGPFPQNDTAILLKGLGSAVVSNNLITGSYDEGLTIAGDAALGAGSAGNCLVVNDAAMVNDASSPVTFENNWWGSIDGPSGSGSGSGGSISSDIDYTPWLTNPPEICNAAPVVDDDTFTIAENAAVGVTVGTVAATDDGDSLAYSVIAGDPGGAFGIDSAGLITVAAPLDFETTPSYSLTVSVTDGFESDTAAVTVTVTDIYETPTTPTFDDVPVGHTFFADIEWLAADGITKGCNPPGNDLFCPDASVTRGQMAAFLHRALGGDLTPGAVPSFSDIAGSIFEADIEWLGAVGVTKGCNPPVNDMFCPDSIVTREQMAAFLVRALSYSAGAGSDQFSDDNGSVFEADIERLAEAGVTKGCNPPTNDMFCPSSPVSRGQMAAFLHRALS